MIRTYLLFHPHAAPRHEEGHWRPNADLYHCKNDLIVRVEAAGMRLEDFDITVDPAGTIIVTGHRVDRTPKEQYLQMEVPFGTLQAVIDLPANFYLDHERITASYDNGFLTLRCPERKPKRIPINTTQEQEGVEQ